MSLLAISNLMLWVVVLLLAGVVLALARQIGVLHERIRPAGALMLQQDLAPGDDAPRVPVTTLDGRSMEIGLPGTRSTLLFFLSTTCPVCKSLLPMLKAAAQEESEWLDVVLASDGDEAEHRTLVHEAELGDLPYVLSAELGMAYRVSKLPFAALIDPQGKLVTFGLVNNREHLDSLFEAYRLGSPSIQDFLGRNVA